MLELITIILIGITFLYTIYMVRFLFQIANKLHTEASIAMLQLTPEETIKELEHSYNEGENTVLWEYNDTATMCYIYTLIIQTSDGRHHKTYVYSDGEQPTEDFKDLEWFEVELKEVTVKAWLPV